MFFITHLSGLSSKLQWLENDPQLLKRNKPPFVTDPSFNHLNLRGEALGRVRPRLRPAGIIPTTQPSIRDETNVPLTG
jgi:hypothetical protein